MWICLCDWNCEFLFLLLFSTLSWNVFNYYFLKFFLKSLGFYLRLRLLISNREFPQLKEILVFSAARNITNIFLFVSWLPWFSLWNGRSLRIENLTFAYYVLNWFLSGQKKFIRIAIGSFSETSTCFMILFPLELQCFYGLEFTA